MPTNGPPERLAPSDIRDNVALARAVGWHDVESDWRVVHEAAVVLGVRIDGCLIAQGALGLYGEAGTIAKMIVAPAFQRRGIGERVFDALLAEADARSVRALGLVATVFGRPLYERRQFTPAGDVVTLMGAPVAADSNDPTVPLQDADAAIHAERPWIRCPREKMLRARFREAIATSSLEGPDGATRGYAMATAQGQYAQVGPVVAERQDDACALTHSVFCAVGGPVRIDVPAEQEAFRLWLRGLGLREQAVRTEMARSTTRLPWQVPQRFALAAQAWG